MVGPLSLPGWASTAPRDRCAGLIAMQDEACCTYNTCGELIVIPIDISAGVSRRYVEGCPICCHPQLIHVHIDQDGNNRCGPRPNNLSA